MNKAKLFSSVFVATIATFSLNAPAFACTDPSSDLNAPKQLADITPTYRVNMENGCFITMGTDLIKIVDNLGVASAAGGAGSGDTSDVFKFTWRSTARSVKLNTNGAQIKIYKDLGSGQRQLLVSSAQFSSSLSFSVAQNSAYLFEFYNSTQDGTHFQYTGIMN
jgi:hypothetical protein